MLFIVNHEKLIHGVPSKRLQIFPRIFWETTIWHFQQQKKKKYKLLIADTYCCNTLSWLGWVLN